MKCGSLAPIAAFCALTASTTAAPRRTVIDDVHVVDVATGEVHRDRRVVLDGSRIAEILDRSAGIPEDAEVIAGAGGFLVPGLWDMHVHIGVESRSDLLQLPLFIAWGITGVLDMGDDKMGDSPPSSEVGAKRRWSEEALAGLRVGPRILGVASHGLSGPQSGEAVRTKEWAFLAAATEDDARRLAHWLKDEMAVDFAKMYDDFPRETYAAFMAEARRIGLPVRGHKPLAVSFAETAAAGQQSVEHMQAIPWESTPSAEEFRGFGGDRTRGFYSPDYLRQVVRTMDADRLRANLEQARAAGMYLTPTHITRKFEAMAATANREFLEDERLELVPARLREWWQADVDRMRRRATSAGVEKEYVEFWRMGYRVTRMAVDMGLPVVTGTDSGDSYCFHGSSLHDELRELVAAGLTPLEALRAATLTPASVLGKSAVHGTVEERKIADLVLLDKNPLEEIGNTRGIAGVFFNGRYFDREALDGLKKSVAIEAR